MKSSSFTWLLSTIIQYVLSIYEYCYQLIQKYCTGTVITFHDTGKRIIIGKQIAEGGFSYIFMAYDATNVSKQRRSKQSQQQQYALKRIHCPDTELMERCQYEANVHRTVMKQQQQNNHVMPLYGFTILQQQCYMLFPLCTESLRDMINRKNPYMIHSTSQHHVTNSSITTTTYSVTQQTPPPISEIMVLQLFYQICLGVQTLHTCGYTHRDIKIENIMIMSHNNYNYNNNEIGTNTTRNKATNTTTTRVPLPPVPHLVLMDFGSAGTTEVMIQNRKQIYEIVELASQHTTMSYRPPELFEGGIVLLPSTTTSSSSNNNHSTTGSTTTVFDYCAVDIWSLGCTLHAMMYGVSPFECEFNTITSSSSSISSRQYNDSSRSSSSTNTTMMGNIKIVDCTHLSILGNIPVPKYLPISSWYSDTIRNELLLPMLRSKPHERLKLNTIIQITERMIVQLGGNINIMEDNMSQLPHSNNKRYSDHQYHDNVDKEDENTDGIALLSRMA